MIRLWRRPTGGFRPVCAVAVEPAAGHYEGQVVPVQAPGHVARHDDAEAVGQRRITVVGRGGGGADAAAGNAPSTAERRGGPGTGAGSTPAMLLTFLPKFWTLE